MRDGWSCATCANVNNMKTRFLWMAAAGLPLFGGCTNASSESQPATTLNEPAVIQVSTNVSSPTNAIPAIAVPVGKPVNTGFTPPEDVKLSASAAEIVKLTQAGVDSGVMLAYVTNSVHTFGLASEEIVYLNDLGVQPAVMTAMIQHDQRIREASLAGATVTSPATPSPKQSVWSADAAGQSSDTWQQPAGEAAALAQPEGVSTATAPPPEELPEPVTVNYFYDSLSPYGTWVDIAGYGRCWRPTVVVANPGWRPYVNGGRWVWTDSGWYWYSDYSWGWAPFHYGRWFSHPMWGWCWMPGSVWGPAWVSWSYTDSYCGWAPLPPAACYRPGFGFTYYGSSCGSGFSFGLSWGCFTYVSYNNFCGRHYDRHCISHHESRRVYGSSTMVNNYIQGDNNTIINHGIGTDRITRATHSGITPVTVRNIETAGGSRSPRTGRNEMLASDGRTLSVTRNVVPGAQPGTHAVGSPHSAKSGALGTTRANSLVPAPNTHGGTASQVGQPSHSNGSGGGRPVARNNESSVVGTASAAPSPTVRSETPRGSSVTTIGSHNDRQPAPANHGATPRLNTSSPNSAIPAHTPTSPWQPSGRDNRAGQPVRNTVNPVHQSAPNNIIPTPPPTRGSEPTQPAGRQNPPRVERYSPQRTFAAPAPPQSPQPYSPPARSMVPERAPLPRAAVPAYTPPSRSVEPRNSPPPRMAPRPSSPPPSAPPSSSGPQSRSDGGGSRSGRDKH